MTTPIDRLRELHRRCSCWGENCGGVRPNVDANSHCAKCIVTWPCDTIAALDALAEGIESARRHMYALNKAVADERDKTRSLQARIDAATVLIRNMIAQDDRVHEVWDGLDEGPCPETAPFRAWLASAKGEGQ